MTTSEGWTTHLNRLDDLHHQRDQLPEHLKHTVNNEIEDTKTALHQGVSDISQGKPHEMYSKLAGSPSGWHPDTVAHFNEGAKKSY